MTVERSSQPQTLEEFINSSLVGAFVITELTEVPVRQWVGEGKYGAYVELVTVLAERFTLTPQGEKAYEEKVHRAFAKANEAGLVGIQIANARARARSLGRQWREICKRNP